ncbi:glycosyltransferase family 4 protein [Microbacterium sp. B2969]|uniref:D-inositol 3-phosphate glycosyltransferase n=1 Tax=Microbacterium alkaliflavum TaxID=3248839 RepID=A0ABW7Q7B7_9MICO
MLTAPRAESIAVAYDCLFPYTTGGGERQYRAFAEELVKNGRRVDYLTARQWTGAEPEAAPFDIVSVSGPLDLYDAAGVRRSAAALTYAWGLFRTLIRRRRSYDAIIVSGLPVLNVFAARAALLGSPTRVVVDYLEVWGRAQWREYAGGLMGTVAWVLQRLAVALTPAATCHSQLTAGRLRSEGLRGELLVSPGLIHSVTDPGPSPATRPPFALYAGRHIPDKRVEVLPAAIERARTEIPDLELVILGEGPSTPAVKAAADDREWIWMPGFVSQAQLDELMGGAACLVNPSRREGYGLVVVEASAHGTPVVLAADEGNAATELVDPDINGFIADTAEPDVLGEAIVAAVRGGDGLRARTRAWYEDAVRTRTIDQTVKRILAFLDGESRPNAGLAPDDREERHA